ncbi:Clp protease N-terminal domain-containing protein [Nonomuraea cavernae]|uniref:Clp protease N-terminal domain-containing protein n=1 Tax=Nonomuraea cavernae TaxID=2045107 RepID=UPI003409691C
MTGLKQAQEEAGGAGHDHIDVGHLVLGLLHEPEALAAKTVEALGVTLGEVREAVTPTLGPATDPPSGVPAFSTQGRKVLELTVREALRLGHNYVGTEHLLLAALTLEGDPAVAALAGLGVTKEPAEREIGRMLDAITRARGKQS